MVFFSLRNCSLSSVVAPRSLLIATVVGHNNQSNQQIAVLWSPAMLQKYSRMTIKIVKICLAAALKLVDNFEVTAVSAAYQHIRLLFSSLFRR